jgi:hypothetical protein
LNNNDDDTSSPEVVDFDALNAALGAPPPAPTPAPSTPRVTDSEGRSSATYASARPHAIPATRPPQEDPNAPAVIISADDTVQTGPPAQMTVPLAPGAQFSAPDMAMTLRPSNAPTPSYPFTPPPFAVQAVPPSPSSDNVNLTLRMDQRPRHPKVPTIILHARGPTNQQKLLVFMAMLVAVVAGGISVLVYFRPSALNLDGRSSSTHSPGVTGGVTHGPSVAPTTSAVLPASIATANGSVSPPPSASTKKPRLLLR